MFKKIFPKQANFFNLFQEAAQELVGAAEQFEHMLQDLSHAEKYAKAIASHESQGDSIAGDTFDLLHKTFITPFDRNDILQLTRKLDDILDLINRTAKRIALYKFENVPNEIKDLARLGLQSTLNVKTVLKLLENLKNTPEILSCCKKISVAESEADHVKMSGIVKLFATENDFKNLFKTKEIYDYSKLITSECHHLANIVKGIVLEYA